MQNPQFYTDLYYHYLYSKFSRQLISEKVQQSIPQKIHYCWFGGNPETDLMKKCMASWVKFCPGYELVLWNEHTFPFDDYPFARRAYSDKKWAFVSDVARLHALYYEGGIYMDTDVEVLQPLNRFLEQEVFSGYESQTKIPTGIMGGKAGHPYLRLLLLWYYKRKFSSAYYGITNVRIISKITRWHYKVTLDGQDLQLKDGTHFYPQEYFCPKGHITANSYCIHHFAGSWT